MIGLLFGEFSKRLRSVRRPWFSRAFAAACRRSRRAAPPGSTGIGFVSGALLPLVALRRFGVSQWFAMFRFGVTCRPSRIVALCRAAMRRYAPVRGDPPHWLAMARYDTPGVRRFTSPSPVGGVTRPDMARILPGPRSGEYRTVSQCRAMARLLSLMHCPTVPPPGVERSRAGRRRYHPHVSRQYSIVRVKALPRRGFPSSERIPSFRATNLIFVPGSPSVRTAEV